jgi:maleylpyruvate isomerase
LRRIGQNGRVPPAELEQRLAQVRASTGRLVDALTALDLSDDVIRQPSLLPGWTRAHVLAHLARNADAIRRGAEGAARGEPAEMYPGGDDARAAAIEAAAAAAGAAILADLSSAAERLQQTWSTLPAAAWDCDTVTRTGRLATWRLVQARWREVEIHRVDLALGYGPADWPAAFVAPLLPSLTDPERLGPRLPAGVAVLVEATDSGQQWAAGSGEPVPVRGPSWALACWLIGRPAAVADVLVDPPPLAAWI